MIRIGTAGWALPKAAADSFPGTGRHLSRYSQVLDCVEINSSFHRTHERAVYERWAQESADGFKFSVKVPKAISHEAMLRGADGSLDNFLAQVAGLGAKLAVLLVQLPPSLEYDAKVVGAFFGNLRERVDAAIVCEPRHASWFARKADNALVNLGISRAAADPVKHSGAELPGGYLAHGGPQIHAVQYFRWHGSPRVYWSAYSHEWLSARACELGVHADDEIWCIFDNTAAGCAAANALQLRSYLRASG